MHHIKPADTEIASLFAIGLKVEYIGSKKAQIFVYMYIKSRHVVHTCTWKILPKKQFSNVSIYAVNICSVNFVNMFLQNFICGG